MTGRGEGGADFGPLPPEFYGRGAGEVARDLLGALVVSEIGGVRCVGEIVETEAYTGPDDEASHAHIRFGKTARNAAMFGPPGIAYVYRIYGMHWCLNLVTGPAGYPAVVLVRAARPVEGLELMRERRGGKSDRDLMRGPGNFCRAMGITNDLNFHPLGDRPLWVEAGRQVQSESVAVGPRIGISRAVEVPLRFWVRGDPYVSR